MADCNRCGTELVVTARYCHQCGERASATPLNLSADQILPRGWPWGKFLICLVVFAGLLWLTSSFWLGAKLPDPVPAKPLVENPDNPVTTYFAVRETKLRSSPTTEGDNVVRSVGRGEEVKGRLETGPDGKTLWVNTGKVGPYVAELNLSKTAPPPLELVLDEDVALSQATTLYTAPGDGEEGLPLATLGAGDKAHVSGLVGNWFEVTLKQGGVAYFKPEGKAEKKLLAKAMADFGDGPDPEPSD